MSRPAPRRLWVLTTEYEPHIIGGLGTVATNLSKALARRGMQITVLSRSAHARIGVTAGRNLRIVRFPQNASYHSRESHNYKPAAIARWMNEHGHPLPERIHVHSVQFADAAKFYRMKYNIPVVYTCHSLIAMDSSAKGKKRQTSLNRQTQLLKTADKVAVPSRSELVRLRKLYPFCTGKAVVINHGIALQKSVAHGPSHHLLFVGRLISIKGIEHLFQAVSLLKSSDRKVKLFMIGTGSRRYMRHLKALARQLGIASHVRWLGYRKQHEVQKMYASFGVLVMPSLQESFGMVALEALASGIPLVATRSGGLSEFVNGKVAQVIPKVDSRSIAAAIRKVWNNKSVTAQRIAAGRKAAARFNWPNVADQYEKLFKRI